MKRNANKTYYPLTSLGVLSVEIIAAPLLAAAFVGDVAVRPATWLAAVLGAAAGTLHVMLARLKLHALLAGSMLGMVFGALVAWQVLRHPGDTSLLSLSLNIAYAWMFGILLGAVAQLASRLRPASGARR